MRKGYLALILFNLAYIIGFTIYYLSIKNYEFMIYIGVLVALFVLVFAIQKRVKFSYTILWMLSIWGLLHMMGGGVQWPGDEVLYRWVPYEFYNAGDALGEFVILKFDQVLHWYVYFIMSFVLVHLLKGKVKVRPLYFYTLVALASMGLGVVNELVEFAAAVGVQDTGVGGYYNTSLDLVFNTLGALSGAIVAALLPNKFRK